MDRAHRRQWEKARGADYLAILKHPRHVERPHKYASNVIPSTATAAIDIRLVKGISHEQAIERLKAHLTKQGYFVVDHAPDTATLMSHSKLVLFKADEFAYDAVRTPMDFPISQAVLEAAARARTPIIKPPIMGGSLPLIMIERQLGVHTIVIPIANYDNSSTVPTKISDYKTCGTVLI